MMGGRIKGRTVGDEIREVLGDHTAPEGLDKEPIFCQVKQ